MNSLDPRVTRLPEVGEVGKIIPKATLDQFSTYEVFVQPKEGKPFQHEGIVHAPNLEMAYLLAKETFTRRFTCYSLCVVDTADVFVSALTEADQNAYDSVQEMAEEKNGERYEIYHLLKRGKQHLHVGSVSASNPENAMSAAKRMFGSGKVIYNIWAIKSSAIRFTSTEEGSDLWVTLPEKKFRDAAEYKGGEKLKTFLEKAR